MLRYFIMIPILALLVLEIFAFVKIISRYRRRYVPAVTMLGIFALNFLLCCGLAYLPLGGSKPMPPAAVSEPLPAK